jgi:hypothetical protein
VVFIVKRFLEIIGVVDTVSFFAGIVYVLFYGSLPPLVSNAFNVMQTAVLVLLIVLGVPTMVIVVLIVQAQLQAPYGER